MIVVDSVRCSYCAGCVSVCPVQALYLAETQLVVDPSCIDCGDCVKACPVGALQPQFSDAPSLKSIQRRYDVVVVGAGPGGSIAARTAAKAGLSVLLIEKRQEIGSPVRCAEGVGHDQLVAFIEPDLRWISAEINQLELTTRDDGATKTWHAAGGRGYILERRVFDRVLGEQAAQAGAEVRVKTSATGLVIEDGCVRGIKIKRGDFFANADQVAVEARVVIGADGVESQVGRWAGLDVQLPMNDAMICAQYLLAGIDIDPTCTSYTISYTAVPGGYAWIFPKGNGKANVGLGVQADLWSSENALGLLNRFVVSNPRLAKGSPVSFIVGNAPVALSPSRIVRDGVMLIGDAARQVDPLTGGGIINAMKAGEMAAQVAAEAIAKNDTSANFLSRYEERWNASVGRRLQRNYRLRDKFPPTRRTDERFVHAFMLAAK
ncbi:MAG: geranylgeranyl reductase family protein [Chloroflexi bacterium]|nr:geranylgeranyl reductase family protein [Chloroflexota bacterium]